tara:strand:- start:26199 stop:27014 length:816 start_codon:yes stop_codon:yes gene_type:complete
MKAEGNLRKMKSELTIPVRYSLELHDILEPEQTISMNNLLGKDIRVKWMGYMNSIISGKKLNKVFGEGLSYQEFMESPLAVPSIMRPELSRIHEGVALRDYEWEKKHHLTPHTVYLSNTSDLKVGVTRNTQVPTRWIDQGATQALKIAETPYRQAAGLIEVELKNFVKDKTAWQKMLKNQSVFKGNLNEAWDKLLEKIPEDFEPYILYNEKVHDISYPHLQWPEKIKSFKLEKVDIIEGILTAIKGQYLIFDNHKAINIRSHSGYRVQIEW